MGLRHREVGQARGHLLNPGKQMKLRVWENRPGRRKPEREQTGTECLLGVEEGGPKKEPRDPREGENKQENGTVQSGERVPWSAAVAFAGLRVI